ncbi:MAG: DUF1329 domain-containing protein, partial [Solimonas sp.]
MIWLMAAGTLVLAATQPVAAKASPEQVAQLGGDKLTCIGAERAGNADGSIPAFVGQWSDTYPGYQGPRRY